MASDCVDIVEQIHNLARDAREAQHTRYRWTGSDEHVYYLDGRHSALDTAASRLAFEYAHSDECDWLPRGHPHRAEVTDGE